VTKPYRSSRRGRCPSIAGAASKYTRMARVPSKFAQSARLRSCPLLALCIKKCNNICIRRTQNVSGKKAQPPPHSLNPFNMPNLKRHSAPKCIPATKILAMLMGQTAALILVSISIGFDLVRAHNVLNGSCCFSELELCAFFSILHHEQNRIYLKISERIN